MSIKDYVLKKAQSTRLGNHFTKDRRFRVIARAVVSLVLHLMFAFYNGILGILSLSALFAASSLYYLLLASMRFAAVILDKRRKVKNDSLISSTIGVMLIILSIVFHIIVIISMKDKTAAVYGTVTMITIATFTFTKIITAIITAVKHRRASTRLFKAIHAIRYSEVAVSLLTMQQSMLVSFGGADDTSAVILNACTGAGVCFFITALGIITLKNSRKELPVWQNQNS